MEAVQEPPILQEPPIVRADRPLSGKTEIPLPQRLYSLDALRGFDMFWIMGGEEIFHTLSKATNAPFWNALSYQFDHPLWNGFRAYDLIFPLFLFMAGVSTPFSVGRELEKGKTKNELL